MSFVLRPRPGVSPRHSFPRHLGVTVSALLVMLSAAGRTEAQRHVSGWKRDRSASGALVSVEVRMDGKRAPLYRTAADERYYLEAVRGRNYALQLRNLSPRRIGVLITVDGLNVVNGERSSLSRHEPMYVLDPWESTTIRGWRTSLEHVQRFLFVDEERSYAGRTGQANGDMGWIRVLAFAEVEHIRLFNRNNEISRRDGATDESAREEASAGADERARDESRAAKPGAAAPQSELGSSSEKSLADRRAEESESFPGTGWGDRSRDPVRMVWFDPERKATDEIVLRYEYARTLRDLGIFPDTARLWEREHGEFGFARTPRW